MSCDLRGCRLAGSVAVRNQGTLGGNLCNAAPSAEMAPSLIGLSAKAKIVGPEGERIVPLEDFFKGPGLTVLKKGELLVEIQVPDPSLGVRGVYLKHSIRGSIDLAIVGVAVIGDFEPKGNTCQDVKIVLGAVAPTPMRARGAEELLRGKKIKNGLIEESAEKASAESRPISDVRASEWYRREMVKVLTRQGLNKIMGRTAKDAFHCGDPREDTGVMVAKVKVYVSGDRGIEVEEVDADRARQLIGEARAQGRCIIDKKIGEVIEDWKPGVEEVLIFDIVEGG